MRSWTELGCVRVHWGWLRDDVCYKHRGYAATWLRALHTMADGWLHTLPKAKEVERFARRKSSRESIHSSGHSTRSRVRARTASLGLLEKPPVRTTTSTPLQIRDLLEIRARKPYKVLTIPIQHNDYTKYSLKLKDASKIINSQNKKNVGWQNCRDFSK